MDRRSFLKSTGALSATIALPNILRAGFPSEKLGIAVIGCGNQGASNPGIAANERLVALVDVDEKILGGAVERVSSKAPKAKTYHDYRKMFDECHKDIDAVMIATPDHHHAPAAIRAIQLGKHVWVEKPMTWCIYEARKLRESAAKAKLATQMGNQGHSAPGYRTLCEYIWAGAIGNVVETHSLQSRNFGGSDGRPPKKPVPPGVHWDEWLGPAQVREYHDGLHPFAWRNWLEFGTGTLGDMGCHLLDGTFWALKLAEARKFTIECVSQKPGSKEKFGQSNHLRWEFAARGDMPPVKVNSYDAQWPDSVKALEKELGQKLPGGGTLYVGDKGYMVTGTYGGDPRILPKAKHEAFAKPKETIPRSKHGVKGDWIEACKGGEPASSNFNVSGPFTEFVLTGVLASRAGMGKKLEWDVEKTECTNVAEVNQWVKREYRKGWEV